jgi:hypothetical protein
MEVLISSLRKYLLSIAAIVGFAGSASAIAGENSGLILSATASATSGSLDFQITLGQRSGSQFLPLTTLCPGHNFAYTNVTDVNYDTIVKNITAAITFKSTAYVYWTVDASGYCHITEIYY